MSLNFSQRELIAFGGRIDCLRLPATLRTAYVYSVIVFCTSCQVWNPNKVYNLQARDLPTIEGLSSREIYRIQPGDRLSMLVYTNNGYKLVDAGLANASGSQTVGITAQLTYLVGATGIARFPMIDTVMVAGYTLDRASVLLESRYSEHLVDPWVQLRVINRRAFIYRGNEQASVIDLQNENMTLMEVIAMAGGIPPTGKAYQIKLVRETEDGPVIYRIDLRDGSNISVGQTIVEANDLILIDPTFQSTFAAQLTPFLALVTSGIAVYGLFRSLQP